MNATKANAFPGADNAKEYPFVSPSPKDVPLPANESLSPKTVRGTFGNLPSLVHIT